LWQVSERVGIRAEGAFSWSSSEFEESEDSPASSSTFRYADGSTSTVTSESLSLSAVQSTTSFSGSVGASLLITLTRSDTFRTYVAPRMSLAMSRSTSTIEFDTSRLSPLLSQLLPRTFFGSQELTTRSRTPSGGAAFGAAATVNDRISVFGEIGFNYTSSHQPVGPSTRTSVSTSQTLTLRSGVGATIYF
jgi:hypothetical protein